MTLKVASVFAVVLNWILYQLKEQEINKEGKICIINIMSIIIFFFFFIETLVFLSISFSEKLKVHYHTSIYMFSK